MTQGRKRKPSALEALGGNPGKRKVNKAEPKPPVVLPPPSGTLDDCARGEYLRVGKLLERMKIVTELDGSMLEIYAVNYSRWVEAETKVREEGLMKMSPNGFPIQNPYLAVANRAMKEMRSILVEFGMSPSSRAKVSVVNPPSKDPEEEKADRILD